MKEIKNNSNIESIENIDSLLKVDKNSKTFYGICLLFITLILLILFMLIFTKRNSISKSELRIDENSLILIKENDKYGFINTNGKTIISPKYDKADIFIGNYAKVLDDETYVLIDKNGKELFKSKNSNDIEYIKDYNVWLILENLYDSNMNKLNSKNTMIKYIDKGYFKWINENNKKAGIMNYKGKVTYTYNLSKDEKNFSFNEIGYENEFDKDKYYCIISVDNTKYGIVNCNTGKILYDFTENNISKKISSCFEIKNIKNYSFIERIIVANNKVVYKTKENNEIISWKELAAAVRRYISRYLIVEKQNTDINENNILESRLIYKDLWRKSFENITNLEQLINDKINKFKITVGQAFSFYEIIGEEDKNSIIPIKKETKNDDSSDNIDDEDVDNFDDETLFD